MESSHKRTVQDLGNHRRNEQLLKRGVPVTNIKSSTTSGKRHSSESSKSKERKTSKERKIEEETKLADVDSIMKENLPAPEDREVGQFQMNDLMTRVLEDELQTIMIKVWRALPDDPPSRTEKYVADKLRNEVSDDLRNVLGLNVSKRLLNVYNPLYVKLHFSHRPESGYLSRFLNSYNAEIFKRINREKSKNTFVARLKSISDFDKICSSQHIRCGTARIRVAPFYNFTKCPAKLNTIFSNEDITNDDESETIVKESTAEETTVVDKKLTIENNKTYVPQKRLNTEVKKSLPQKKTDIKEVKTTVSQKKTNIEEVKTSVPKKKTNDDETIKTVSGKKSNIKVAKKTEEVKSAAEKRPNVEKNKKSVLEKKPNIQKGKNSLSAKKTTVNEVKKSVTQKKSLVVGTQKVTNKSLENNVKTKSKTEVKETPKKIDIRDFQIDETEIVDEIGEYDDDDEMNDEEILALIAGGVVVDECSGSDME